MENYDACLNTSVLGYEGCADSDYENDGMRLLNVIKGSIKTLYENAAKTP
ncbi:MAG: hypothetical protein ACLR0U_16180 [Enterocloster clostridioformis]